MTAPGQPFIGAALLIGVAVRDSHEQMVGHVRDVMLDTQEGRIAYVDIALSGTDGGQVVVPWSAVTAVDPSGHCRVAASRRSLARIAATATDG